MTWPQIVMIVWISYAVLNNIAHHGEDHRPHDGWLALIAMAILGAVLWFGGFWQ